MVESRRRSRAARGLVALALVAAASAAAARTPRLPPAYAGRVSLEVLACEPLGSLRVAHVQLRTAETAVSLPDLECGAFGPAGDALFLTRVASAERLPAHAVRDWVVRFPADAQHGECGCGLGGARDLADDLRARPFADPEATEEVVLQAPQTTAGPPPEEIAPPGLRFERVLVPDLALRRGPGASEPALGELEAGARVAVDRIAGGWKQVRTPDGRSGWLPDEASTADVTGPEQLTAVLLPLVDALWPEPSDHARLCTALDRRQLAALVYLWRPEAQSVFLRPVWYALPREEQRAFRIWAGECYGATHLVEALRNREIRSLEWEGDGPR
jgi:hypothetical protein